MKWLRSIKKPYKVYKDSYFIEVGKAELEKVLAKLKLHGVNHISSISGHDTGDRIELNYHFVFEGKTITVKTRIARKNSCIRTITNIYPGAILYERELWESLGVKIEGHPEMGRVFLSRHSPKAPLRRD